MRLSFKSDRVLAVVAHPDDAELLCAGTLARAKSEGAAIGICVLCRGDKGKASDSGRNAAVTRRKEMVASARLIGSELFAGNVPDGTVMDDVRTRRLLIEIFRRFKPTLVLA